MQEFIVLIYVEETPIQKLSKNRQEQHLLKVGQFIKSIHSEGKLINAHPFEPVGISISGNQGVFKETVLNTDVGEVVGYYHLSVASMEEAASVVKSDPRFDDARWKMEIWKILRLEGIN